MPWSLTGQQALSLPVCTICHALAACWHADTDALLARLGFDSLLAASLLACTRAETPAVLMAVSS